MQQNPEMRLKNDKRLRDKLYTPESYQHPAKGHLGLWQAIIEKYTQPGDTILDPMAGVGATLTAALMGRNVVCVELEQHFVAPMRASWEKMKQHPLLGHTLGEVLILRGDARCLPLNSADCVVTSPPYEGNMAEGKDGIDWTKTTRDGDTSSQPHLAKTTRYRGYTRPVSAIITSPPYEGSEVAQSSDGEANRRFRDGDYKGDALKGMGLSKGYTRPHVDAVISSPPYAEGLSGGGETKLTGHGQKPRHYDAGKVKIDAIVSSPPYEGSIAQGRDGIDWSNTHREDGKRRDRTKESATFKTSAYRGYTPNYDALQQKVNEGRYNGKRPDVRLSPTNLAAHGYLDGYAGGGENIGNQRGDAYWDSMRQVYAEAYRVLRPGGIMALVLKGFTRNGQYIDLPQQTADLVESLGFTKFDEWRRELWSLSFWRILQRRRSPETFDDRLRYESVLAFRK